MQIASVISPIQVSQASMQAAPATVATTAQKVTESVNLETAGKAKQTMEKYDLHNISYGEVNVMVKELADAGVISEGHLLDYTSLPDGEFNYVDGKVAFLNSAYEKKDFLKNLDDHLAYVETYQASDISTVTHMRRMVNLFHNLDALSAHA